MRFICGLILLCIAGCSNVGYQSDMIRPVEEASAVKLAPGQAAVVVGVEIANPQHDNLDVADSMDAIWVAVDPVTGRRNGPALETIAGTLFQKGGLKYFLYALPSGTYALGYISHPQYYGSIFFPTEFADVRISGATLYSISLSQAAQVRPNTPIFHAGAAEVVYIGDLAFDFTDPKRVHWTVRQTEEAARAYLSSVGLADRMVVRPLARFDGKPFGSNEGTKLQLDERRANGASD